MATTIRSPQDGFTGSTYIGPTILDFTNGTATTDVPLAPGTVRYLQRAGYEVEQGGATQDGDDLFSLTVDQLRDYADTHGVDLAGASRKADIVAAIAAANQEGGGDQ